MTRRRWIDVLAKASWLVILGVVLPLAVQSGGAQSGGAQSGGAQPADESTVEAIELIFLNGDHTELDAHLRPVEQGPLTIRLSSPEHQLTVHRNYLTFAPDGSGAYASTVEVDLEGEGKLFADVEGVGMSSRFEDDVEAPRQVLKVVGKVRLERVEGGYQVTMVEAPTASRLEIRSGVIRQIVDFCRALDGLPLVSLDCPAIEIALTRQEVPMPKAGGRFFLAGDRLNDEERAFFDRLSEGS